MKNLRYICCQPALPYYEWQVEVVINNFIKMGIDSKNIDIVCAINGGEIPKEWQMLQDSYPVNFHFYNDTREDKGYIPSIYFNMMKQYVAQHPQSPDDIFFIHDSDIIFTKAPDFRSMLNNDSWYLSDTNSYINYYYIQSKGNDIYEKMCDIVGIDKRIPKIMNSNSGGAQYIVKNTTFEFWDKVEKDSVALYQMFNEMEPSYIPRQQPDYPIQKWTAGMWSFLWNAWYFGHETIVDDRLGFAWVTDNKSTIDNHVILHNSGVTDSSTGLFYKGNYINKLPYGEILDVNEEKASYFYWKEVLETGKKSIFMQDNLKQTFSEIHSNNLWASPQSRSGTGSELINTEKIRQELPIMLSKFNINSMLDIPCGDYNWMCGVDLGLTTYIGADIVEGVITKNIENFNKDFRVLDITKDDLPKSDLLFVRDCLGHLSNANVIKAIENMKRSGSKYLLATSFTKYNFNTDIKDGGWKCINLMIEPFFLNPIYLINEDCQEGYPDYNDKCMILFKLN